MLKLIDNLDAIQQTRGGAKMATKKAILYFLIMVFCICGSKEVNAYEILPGCYGDNLNTVNNCCEDQCQGNERYYNCFVYVSTMWPAPGYFHYHCNCNYNDCTYGCEDSGGTTSCLSSSNCHGSSQPGDTSYCSSTCPCEEEEGDCDSDSECQGSLQCEKNYIGGCFGYSWSTSVCLSYSIECTIDSDCDDGNSSTNDLCHYPCQDRAYCTNNPICTSNCTPSASNTCVDSNTYQSCVEVSANCYQWQQYDCASGTSCSNGSCCNHECNVGSAGCVSTNQVWFCGENNDGDSCRDVIYNTCITGYACDNGACIPGCIDECNTGDTGCNGTGQRWTCGEANDGDVCLDKIYIDCSSGTTCSGGTCTSNCVHDCNTGEVGCNGLSEYWTCGEANDGDTCRDKIYQSCGTREYCSNGTCVCNHGCNTGQIGCNSSGTQRYECLTDSDGCRYRGYWYCSAGTTCSNGVCSSTCSNECSPGSTGCSSTSQRWTCGENDGDTCLDKINTNCSLGTYCANGSCVIAPTISLTRPNVGEVIYWGGSLPIFWSTTGSLNPGVDVQLSCDGGNTWEEILTGIINNGAVSWNSLSQNSQTCRIKILGYYPGGYVLDISGDFTITNSQDHKTCHDNDVYWVDYFGNRTALETDCGDGTTTTWDTFECQGNDLYRREHNSTSYCNNFNFNCSSTTSVSSPIHVGNCYSSTIQPYDEAFCPSNGQSLLQEFVQVEGFCDSEIQACNIDFSNTYIDVVQNCDLMGGGSVNIGDPVCNQGHTSVVQEFGAEAGYCDMVTDTCQLQTTSLGYNVVEICNGAEICIDGIGQFDAQCMDALLPQDNYYVIAEDKQYYVVDTCDQDAWPSWLYWPLGLWVDWFPLSLRPNVMYGPGNASGDGVSTVLWRDAGTTQVVASEMWPTINIDCSQGYGTYEYDIEAIYGGGAQAHDTLTIELVKYYGFFSLNDLELSEIDSISGRHHLRYEMGSHNWQVFDLHFVQSGNVDCTFGNPNDQMMVVIGRNGGSTYVCDSNNPRVTLPAGEWTAYVMAGVVTSGLVDIYADYHIQNDWFAAYAYKRDRILAGSLRGICDGNDDYVCIGSEKFTIMVAETIDLVFPATAVIEAARILGNAKYIAKHSYLVFTKRGRDNLEQYVDQSIAQALQASPNIALNAVFIFVPGSLGRFTREIRLTPTAYSADLAADNLVHMSYFHFEKLGNLKKIKAFSSTSANPQNQNSLARAIMSAKDIKLGVSYNEYDPRFLSGVNEMDNAYAEIYNKMTRRPGYWIDGRHVPTYGVSPIDGLAPAAYELDDLFRHMDEIGGTDPWHFDFSAEKFKYAHTLARFFTERVLEREGVQTAKFLGLKEFGQKIVIRKNSQSGQFWPIRDVNDITVVQSGNPSLGSNEMLHEMGWVITDPNTGDLMSLQSRWGYSAPEAHVAAQKDFALMKYLYPNRKINTGFVSGFKGNNVLPGENEHSLVVLAEADIDARYFDQSVYRNFQITVNPGTGPDSQMHVTGLTTILVPVLGNQRIDSLECTATEGIVIQEINISEDGTYLVDVFISNTVTDGEVCCTGINFDGVESYDCIEVIADGANHFRITIRAPMVGTSFSAVEIEITATQPVQELSCVVNAYDGEFIDDIDWFNESEDRKFFTTGSVMHHQDWCVECTATNYDGISYTDNTCIFYIENKGCSCKTSPNPQAALFYILVFVGMMFFLRRRRKI